MNKDQEMKTEKISSFHEEPRHQVVEAYLSHGSQKAKKKSQMAIIKEQGGLSYFLTEFHSSVQRGLSKEQISHNEQRYGKNQYKKKNIKGFCQLFIDALKDQMLIILMIGAVISIVVEFFFSEQKDTFWIEGASILSAVLVVSLVGSLNDYQKQKQFQQLNAIQESTNTFRVLRNGQKQQINKTQIVVGDILFIEGGNQMPADCLVITAEEIVVDEGSITGEATEKYKNTIQICEQQKQNKSEQRPSPILVSGTSIMSGNGKVLVLVVGKQSTAGKLNEQIMDDDNEEKTPLQMKLDVLVEQIVKLGMYSAIAVVAALIIRLLISDIIPDGWEAKHLGKILEFLILGVTIIVVAIPQGLPLAVTLSLAYSVKKMLHQNNLVRKLASCETMGGAHIICTDKTGTLTQNQMSIVQVWDGRTQTQQEYAKKFDKSKTAILNSLMLNTKAELQPKPTGSSTQLALLKYCRELSPQYYQQTLQTKQSKIQRIIPFNSRRKRMTTLINENGKRTYLQKGGVQIVLNACELEQNFNGQVKNIDKRKVNEAVQKMAKKGLRVIALAFKDDKSDDAQIKRANTDFDLKKPKSSKHMLASSPSNRNQASELRGANRQKKDQNGVLQIEKSGFTLQLLLGIKDLPRQQTVKAIENCNKAGVLVIMVTGDNAITARAIADQVGITKPNQTGQQFVRQGKWIQSLSPQDQPYSLQRKLRNLKVLARSRPQHKLRLVQCLKKLNNVVAVTGDGTNDAPALINADVGFSMGIKGTQIAKSASDIIIKDDRFDSMVRALIWGRNIYESIRKFLQFQLTINIVACLISVISSVVIRQSVMTAVQMLWVNMIMDSLASLALATQPPNGEELLNRKPFQKRESIITKTMMKHIIGQSIYQLLVLLLLIEVGPLFIPESADRYDQLIGSNLQAKYYHGEPQGTVTSGMAYTYSGDDNYIKYYAQYGVYSRHFTFIFNTFVMMQFFNFFNCRRIKDQFNILDNPCSNSLYWIIIVFIFLFQWLIITFLNVFFKLYNFGGLTPIQWLMSILIGLSTIALSMGLRALPIAKPQKYQSTPDDRANDIPIQYRTTENQRDDHQLNSSNKYDQVNQIQT